MTGVSHSLLSLADSKDESVELAKSQLQETAEKYFKLDQDAQPLLFFYTNEDVSFSFLWSPTPSSNQIK